MIGLPLEVALGAVVLALLHVVGARLRFIHYIPRSGWLSFAGGVSVAYVFLHLLPELAEAEEVLAESGEMFGIFSDQLVWLVAVAGLLLFYGIEVASRRSRGEVRGDASSAGGVFWFSMGSYAIYNLLIAYLLHKRAEEGTLELTLFVAAIAMHFLVNDFALREHHKEPYHAIGRWILVAGIVGGALLGAMTEVAESIVAASIAFIGGGIVLNVLKEELPSDAESRFPIFALGLVSYSALLLFL